jgi:hypothetical protein
VMPKMFREGTQTTIVMPWDAAYASTPGDSAPPFDYSATLLSLPSRMVIDRP